jgi:hypothetical protein
VWGGRPAAALGPFAGHGRRGVRFFLSLECGGQRAKFSLVLLRPLRVVLGASSDLFRALSSPTIQFAHLLKLNILT